MQTQLEALRRVTAAREPGHLGTTTLAALLPDLQTAHPSLPLTAHGPGHPLPLAACGPAHRPRPPPGNAAQHGATAVTLDAAPDATLTVTDNGTGISAGNRTQIFTPFFTTTRDHGGTGMGLTITANLLRAHGADITLTPSPTGPEISARSGTTFRITFASQT